jgi:MFS family permease
MRPARKHYQATFCESTRRACDDHGRVTLDTACACCDARRLVAVERQRPDAAPMAARGVFHGWWIVLVTFVCNAVNTGLVFYAWGIFLTPLAAEFGGRGRVAGAYSTMQLASSCYGLVIGRLVDRHGARFVGVAGACALALGFLLLSQAGSLVAVYLCLGVPVAIGATCLGPLTSNTAVARWFVRRRGQALGISTAGISAGGIVFAPLMQYLVVRIGWRGAFAVAAAIVVVLVIPLVLTLMRHDPADMGLEPDGMRAGGATADEMEDLERELERSVRPETAVRQPSFWLLAASFGLTFAGLSAVLLYQVPLLIDRGIDDAHAAFVLGATAAMGVIGKLGFGALLDRFDQRRIASMCFCLQTLGVGLLWLGTTPLLLGCYVVLYGYAMGGNATLLASLIGRTFGRLHYGSIAGRMSPELVLAPVLGVPATGFLRDATGSYGPALAAVMAMSALAAVIVTRVRLP